MKNLFLLLTIAIIGCSPKRAERYVPDSNGNLNHVTVVMTNAQWKGILGETVRKELASEYDGKALVGKVNVDLHGGIAAQFGVRNIPTIVFLKNGELVDKVVGAVPKNQLAEKLEANI